MSNIFKRVSLIVFLFVGVFFSCAMPVKAELPSGVPSTILLKHVSTTATAIYIQWQDYNHVGDDVTYEIYRDNVKISETNDRQYVVGGIKLGVSYRLQVKAIVEGKLSAVSNFVTATCLKEHYPNPVSGHPRLYIRSEDIPEILAKTKEGNGKVLWLQICDMSDKYNANSCKLPDRQSNFDQNLLNAIEATALRYLLTSEKSYGQQAVAMAKNYINTVSFSMDRYVRHVTSGYVMHMTAVIYDWCYPLLTSDDKQFFMNGLLKLAQHSELGFPPKISSGVVGHSSECGVLKNLLAAGIATYDETNDYYSRAALHVFRIFKPVRDFAYQAGMHYQGLNYGPYRYSSEAYAAWMIKKMGMGDIFGEQIGDVPLHWIYARRPDGQLFRDGDMYMTRNQYGDYWNIQTNLIMGQGFNNDLGIQKEILKKYTPGAFSPAFELLLWNPNQPGATEELPYTRYFDSPGGVMIARTGWEEDIDPKNSHTSPVMMAEMKVNEFYFGNHMHFDAGQFEVYYKGPLAIDSGIYESKDTGYGSSHHMEYHKKSIAHNTMLVYDPNEDTINGNDGGQRQPNIHDANNLDDLFQNGYRIGYVTGHSFGPDPTRPDYSYLSGDIAKAYSSKVKDYQRSFVFLNFYNLDHPGALLVYDRVNASNPDYKKTYLLHTMEEPIVEKNVTTVQLSETANGNYNGKMVNHTILPSMSNLEITKVGGPGKEFVVNGNNYPATPNDETCVEEDGAWRIEVSPIQKKQADTFLNVMQVIDNRDGPEPLGVSYLESDKLDGVKIYDRVVWFGKGMKRISDSISFTIPGNERNLKILLTNIKEGFWRVSKDGKKGTVEYEVKLEEGVLYFPGGSGNYTLTRSSKRTMPEPSAMEKSTTAERDYSNDISITINGKKMYFPVAPFYSEGTMMVPYESLLHELNANWSLDEKTGTVTIQKGTTEVTMKVNSKSVMRNKQEYSLPATPLKSQGRIYVPLRFVCESLNTTVEWDPLTKGVSIAGK